MSEIAATRGRLSMAALRIAVTGTGSRGGPVRACLLAAPGSGSRRETRTAAGEPGA